jgi:acyl carrier protein
MPVSCRHAKLPTGAISHCNVEPVEGLIDVAKRAKYAPASTFKKGHWKTMSKISERVKKIIVEHLGIDPDKVTEDANFIDDLGADSLDTVELTMSFEEEFGCEIPDEAAESMFTVGDVIKFLETNAKN